MSHPVVNSTVAPYVGRFAPTPNGHMHEGTAAAALLAWSHARAAGGRFLLRWDDLDGLRCREEFVDGLRADLAWLGVDWDGEVRQRDRVAEYGRALAELAAAGSVYRCLCSRSDIRARIAAGGSYDGRCRARRIGRGEAEAVAATSAWVTGNPRPKRPMTGCLRLDLSVAGAAVGGYGGPAAWERSGGTDVAAGGDPVIWSAEGYASYTLSCAVDEAGLGVTDVVRGRDLLPETAAQIAVLRALGVRPPRYVHFGLVLDADGRKLSKSAGAVRLRDRSDGDARTIRDRVGAEWFDPPVEGDDLPGGWGGTLVHPKMSVDPGTGPGPTDGRGTAG